MKYAIDILAEGVILVHNHPSGNTKPSQGDIDITKRLKTALKHFEIDLLDHLILTKDSYSSMADTGHL